MKPTVSVKHKNMLLWINENGKISRFHQQTDDIAGTLDIHKIRSAIIFNIVLDQQNIGTFQALKKSGKKDVTNESSTMCMIQFLQNLHI